VYNNSTLLAIWNGDFQIAINAKQADGDFQSTINAKQADGDLEIAVPY